MKNYYVYLVRSYGKMYKIGYTNNIQRREKEYKTHNPNANIIEYIAIELETLARWIEEQAHDEIETVYNVREWFKPKGKTFHLVDLQCLKNGTIIKNKH